LAAAARVASDGDVTPLLEVRWVKIDAITGEIIRAALVVHSSLGPGLLENVYRACLTHLLRQNGLG
jgi:hypothetical protein